MKPEDFELLSDVEKQKVIKNHDENFREWWMRCPKCGFRMTGTLRELRGCTCGACGTKVGGANG